MVDIKQLRVIDDRRVDKWNGSTATDRIEADLRLYKGIVDLMFSMFKEEGEEEEASCSKIPISLMSYTIKLKFDDDNFLSSKYNHIIYIVS